jgi:nucleoid DNA-binding protein
MSDCVTRADFVRNLVQTQGFTYVQASAAYDSFIKTIEDGICAGSKIHLSKVGTITPVKYGPRIQQMGFRRTSGTDVEKVPRTYYLGSRIKYKFILFKSFMANKTLAWKLD